ncbi:MAG: hypothetical protein U0T78_04715 [Cloacibacterium normanense]
MKKNNGAKRIIANGFTDWKYEVGISQPNKVLSVCLSAKIVSEAPACSNAHEENHEKARIKITIILSLSSFVRDLSVKIMSGIEIIAP